MLVHGLSEKALKKIRQVDMAKFTNQLPVDLGSKFYNHLAHDRNSLKPCTNQALVA